MCLVVCFHSKTKLNTLSLQWQCACQ